MVVPSPLCEPGGVDSADGHHQMRRRDAVPAGDGSAPAPTTTGGDGRPVAAVVVLVCSLVLAVVAVALWRCGALVAEHARPVRGPVVLPGRPARRGALRHGGVGGPRPPLAPVGWILTLTAVGGGLAAVSFQWTVRLASDPDLPLLRPLASAQQWGWVPGTLALVTVVPWLVRDTPPGRWSLPRSWRAWP